MKQILVVIILSSFLLESCIIGNSASFLTPLKINESEINPYSRIQIHKDHRVFIIPPFFYCQFDKKLGSYFLEYDFYTKDSLVYNELLTINYVFYNEIGEMFSSGSFDINSKIERQILIGNEALRIPTDTLYRVNDQTVSNIIIPDSIQQFKADFTFNLQRVSGDLDSLKISKQYKLDRQKGVYSIFNL